HDDDGAEDEDAENPGKVEQHERIEWNDARPPEGPGAADLARQRLAAGLEHDDRVPGGGIEARRGVDGREVRAVVADDETALPVRRIERMADAPEGQEPNPRLRRAHRIERFRGEHAAPGRGAVLAL